MDRPSPTADTRRVATTSAPLAPPPIEEEEPAGWRMEEAM